MFGNISKALEKAHENLLKIDNDNPMSENNLLIIQQEFGYTREQAIDLVKNFQE